MPTAFPGPTANLKGTQRRIGRSGTCWINGEMHGEVTGVEWGAEAEVITISIPGTFRDETKPGGETYRGTFNYDDVDDRWRLFVWRFFEARRTGDRSGAAFPSFDIITKLDDIGAPAASTWVLVDCQFFSFDGGASQGDGVLQRSVPFQFSYARPLEAFEYGANGIVITRA